PDGAVAVPMLVDLLDDESPEVVAAAARAIDSMAVAGVRPMAAFCSDPTNWKDGSQFREGVRGLPVLALALGSPIATDLVDEAQLKECKPSASLVAIAALLDADAEAGGASKS